MSARPDRTTPAFLLLAFGLAPWVDACAWFLLEDVREGTSGETQEALAWVIAASVLAGAVAAVVALVAGIVATVRSRGADDDGPRRTRRKGSRWSIVARVATLTAVIGLWGPFGIWMLEPVLAPSNRYLFLFAENLGGVWTFVSVTLAAAVAGAALLVRGRAVSP